MPTPTHHGRSRAGRRRVLSLLAVPIFVAQCAPTTCSPAPAPEPAPTTTAAPVATTVAPAPASYAFLASNGAGFYTRWSSCEADAPITWQLDTTVVPSQGFRDALAAALATVTAATGHRFEQLPDLVPGATPTAEAVIGLRTFSSAGTLGQGGGRFNSSYLMVSGVAYVASRLDLPENATLLRTAVLHEIGHMVGLGHPEDPAQLMYYVLRQAWQEYQQGDLLGLSLVGATQPCLASLMAADDEPLREVVITH